MRESGWRGSTAPLTAALVTALEASLRSAAKTRWPEVRLPLPPAAAPGPRVPA
jgi:hypothetical protein